MPGVYLTTQVHSPPPPADLVMQARRPGNMFTNPDWPPALGTARRDRDNLRARVIALIRDQDETGGGRPCLSRGGGKPLTGEDEMWRVLFGRASMTVEQARAWLAQMQADALADEAEQAAHGVRHLTVEHGDMESADDEQRLHRLSQWAHDNRARARITTRSSNDTTTWFIGGPDAAELAADLEALAHRLNPGWWHIRRTAR